MSDQTNVPGAQPTQQGGYSAEYVKSIREEAASWRTKLREAEDKYNALESKMNEQSRVNNVTAEFTKRGIKADPKWVSIEEGQKVEQAVDKFLKDYPQFVAQQQDSFLPTQQPVVDRKPMQPQAPNSNIENTAVSELGAVKKDPIARAKLRDHYRAMLQQSAGCSNRV